MPRNVLLAVVGLTPQVVTETLFHLTQVRKLPVHEIRLVTTRKGAERAQQTLLDEEKGALWEFCRAYEIDPQSLVCPPAVVIADGSGRPLDDIRSEQDNTAAGNQILKIVAEYTSDPNVRLFCSLAGGRKTMSTFAGLAMQLLGREQDELLHVLVRPPELESRRDFFFPPREGDFASRNPDGSSFQVPRAEIAIDCASVPFVRLRRHLPPRIDPRRASYADLVALAQDQIDLAALKPSATLSLRERILHLTWNGGKTDIRVTPSEAALLHFFLSDDESLTISADDLREQVDEFLSFRNRLIRRRQRGREEGTLMRQDPQLEFFRQTVSKWKKKLRDSGLDPLLVEILQIKSRRSGALTEYYCHFPANQFKILDLETLD